METGLDRQVSISWVHIIDVAGFPDAINDIIGGIVQKTIIDNTVDPNIVEAT